MSDVTEETPTLLPFSIYCLYSSMYNIYILCIFVQVSEADWATGDLLRSHCVNLICFLFTFFPEATTSQYKYYRIDEDTLYEFSLYLPLSLYLSHTLSLTRTERLYDCRSFNDSIHISSNAFFTFHSALHVIVLVNCTSIAISDRANRKKILK